MGAARLDRAGAHRRAQRVRDGVSAISEVVDTLIEIQERQDWLALNYKTWAEYCEGEFGPNRLKLTAEQRSQVVAVLVASGMPKRRVATALGVSEGTVRNDAKRSKGAQNYALPGATPQVDGQSSDDNTTQDPVASSTDDTTDGERPTALGDSPATGPGAQVPEGEADRPGPVVTPQTTEEANLGETGGVVVPPSEPSAPTGVSGVDEATESAGAGRPPVAQLAEEVDVEQAPEGVPAPPPPQIPAWFPKVSTAVIAINDLIEQDPDEVGEGIPNDWAGALGDSMRGLVDWCKELQQAINRSRQ